MNITASNAFGTPEQLGVDIASMTNYIAEQLNDWAVQEQGIAVVAENLNEKVLIGWNNCIGPKCLVVYDGEEMWGDASVSDLVGWAKRNFSIIIERGKVLSDPRNSVLTKTYGASKPFYKLVEGCRDTLRQMLFPTPMVYNPPMYNGMMPGNRSEKNEWLLDSYIMSIAILVQLPRIQTLPPQFGGGDFVNLNGDIWYPNSTPSA